MNILMETLKSFITGHVHSLDARFKFSAAHTCRSLLHSLEGYADANALTFTELTPAFCLNFEHHLLTTDR